VAVPVNLSLINGANPCSPGPVLPTLPPWDTYTVERVENSKRASAAIYGSQRGNGVILIFTQKRGELKLFLPAVIPRIWPLRACPQREFYSQNQCHFR